MKKRMRRRRRLRKVLLLPPVILAALFVWLVTAQVKNMAYADGSSAMAAIMGQSDSSYPLSGLRAETEPMKEAVGLIIDTGQLDAEQPDAGIPDAGIPVTDTDTITLLFGGDIYLSSHVLNAYDTGGGIGGILDEGIRTAIGESDIFMANEEFPFSGRGSAALDKEYTFSLPTDRVSVMKEIGPDIVSLANNHTMDFGAEALLDTLETLDNAGIQHVGAGANLDEAKALEMIEVKGKKIGFLAASRVIPENSWTAGRSHPGVLTTYDPGILIKEIEKAKEICDYLVVYVHWGIEKNTHPEEYQRTLGKQYIDAGADIVVGSHPHVLQGIEYYKGKPIVYSLGNFVFGSTIPETALLKVELPAKAEGEPSLKLLPCTSAAGYTRMLNEEKKPKFYSRMEELSLDIIIDADGHVEEAAPVGPSE